jgi:hypothetical protein
MTLLFANLLLLAGAGPMLVLVLADRRTGPEGPVGAHMITGPLALAQVLAMALALWAGTMTGTGWLAPAVGWSLPGYFVALLALPIVALERRRRSYVMPTVVASLAGCALVVDGAAWRSELAFVGGALVLAAGAIGYGILLAMWLQSVNNRARAAAAEIERDDKFQREQSAWQLGEWRKLPKDAELWQLIQFVHALHPEVEAECQARIAALPDLDAKMAALLRTGWAEHALRYVAREYPHSRRALAPALAPFLDAECRKWEEQLRTAPRPETWSVNLDKYVECIRAVIADGGDLQAQAARWRKMLRSIRGLSPLAQQLEAG